MLKSLEDVKNNLTSLVEVSDTVLIEPHINPDCDSLASTLGIYMIVKSLGKNPVVVINENITMLERGVQIILDEIPDSVKIIGKKSAQKMIEDSSSLLIVVDNNKKELFPIDDYNSFENVVVIDHHDVGPTTIETPYMYIDTLSSSASEIMVNLMKMFNVRFDYRDLKDSSDEIVNIANYLLTGIYLDTDGLKNRRARSTTFMAISYLVKSGADVGYASSFFIDDLKTDILIHDMIKATDWKKFNIAIASNKTNPKTMYTKEILAKIADSLVRYKDTDAAFSLGLIGPDLVQISGRSGGNINIGDVMSELGGGGNETCGAVQISPGEVSDVREQLERIIKPGYRLK